MTKKLTTHQAVQKSSTIMEWIVLVGVLLCDNGRSCNLQPFGCGNLLVLNRHDHGAGICHHIWMMMFPNKLVCYIVNSNGSDGCHVWFVPRDYAAGENACRLDRRVIKIMQAYQSDNKNCSMRRLFHHNRDYAYAVVENNHESSVSVMINVINKHT